MACLFLTWPRPPTEARAPAVHVRAPADGGARTSRTHGNTRRHTSFSDLLSSASIASEQRTNWCFWSVEVQVLDLLGAREIAARAWARRRAAGCGRAREAGGHAAGARIADFFDTAAGAGAGGVLAAMLFLKGEEGHAWYTAADALAFVAASPGSRQGGWGGDAARRSRWAALLFRRAVPLLPCRRRRERQLRLRPPRRLRGHLRRWGRRRSRPIGGRAHGNRRGVKGRRGHGHPRRCGHHARAPQQAGVPTRRRRRRPPRLVRQLGSSAAAIAASANPSAGWRTPIPRARRRQASPPWEGKGRTIPGVAMVISHLQLSPIHAGQVEMEVVGMST
ncbi:hypothetical protein PVAP13_6NG211003 [Panicum virgatum]|uniref:Uncharacterized protein n=1 Tax=Panicum virgatum TaxID=38727 RepID=A0A8T0QZ21_PANVG|nr:hypothetical protein PVAP13_6NG211003 [Panicum virgatum]KAG2578491.1 hypothetical protein PVAP13_6NG211003 [Panicum virgatum]